MSKKTSNIIKLVGAGLLAITTLGSNAFAQAFEWGKNYSVVRGQSDGGAYDFKMSSGTSRLYSFTINPDFNTNGGKPVVRGMDIWMPQYEKRQVSGFDVIDGVLFDRQNQLASSFGGKTLLYIHSSNVYFINPEITHHDSKTNSYLEKTQFSRKLPLSTFTGLENATDVHMDSKSLVWVSAGVLYNGGNPHNSSSNGRATVIANNVVEAKSVHKFFFWKESDNAVYVLGNNGNSKVRITGETTLDFIDNPQRIFVSGNADYFQIYDLDIGGGVLKDATMYSSDVSLSFANTGTSRSNQTGSMAGAASQMIMPNFIAKTALKGNDQHYFGSFSTGSLVLTKSGNLVFSDDEMYGSGGSVSHEYTCIDTPNWQKKNITLNNLDAVYSGLPVAAKSHLGGFGDLSVAMLNDGTLRFNGSGSKNLTGINAVGGYLLINGWPNGGASNNQIGFCNPTALVLDESEGPKNVKATKAQYNDKIRLTWDADAPGSKYTIRRWNTDGTVGHIASNIEDTFFDDSSEFAGTSKTAYSAYEISTDLSTPIYTNSGGQRLFEKGVKYSGCSSGSAISKDCTGFKANPPTSGASNLKATAATDMTAQIISTAGFSVVDPDNPYDTFTFALGGPATQGTVSTNASNQFVYSPPAGFIGTDTFDVIATDKAGNSLAIPVNVDVKCSSPVIKSITLPATFNSYIQQLGGVVFDSNACSDSFAMNVKVTPRGSSTVLTQYNQIFSAVPTGTNQTKNFFMINLPAGDYTLNVDMVSERAEIAADNKASRTFDFKVNGVGTYTIASTKPVYTEDELVSINVAGGTCTIQTVNTARGVSGCYVEWGTHPFYQSSNTGPANLSGYASVGNLQTVNAKVLKFDSMFNTHEVATLAVEVTVTPGLPTTLKPISIPAQTVAYLDSTKVVFERDSGYECTIYTSTATANTAAASGQKSCLLEVTMPDGFAFMTGQTSPTILGRFIGSAGTKTIPYKLSKYYAGKAPATMEEGTLTFNVIDPALTMSVVSNKTAFVANGTAASIEAKVLPAFTGGKTCVATTSSSAAQSAYNGQAATTCLVEWDTIPPGLSVDTAAGVVPKLKGMPTTVGENAIKFSAYVVRTIGTTPTKVKVGEYAGTISVTEVTPMTYTITTPKEGTILLTGDTEPRILVGDSGEIGEIEISAGDFSTVKLTVQEYGYAPVVMAGLRNGDKRTISVSSGAKGAWLNRQVTLKLVYEEVAAATEVSRTIELVQLPPQKMAIQIALPGVPPNDTQAFSYTAKMGVPVSGGSLNYSAPTGGVWMAALYVKQGLTMVPITSEEAVTSTGTVTWNNLAYATFVGQDFWAKARYVTPENSTLSVQAQEVTSDKSVRLTFVLGGSLNGPTLLTRTNGAVPLLQTYDVQLTSAQAQSLKTVSWQISTDATNWTYTGVLGRSAKQTITQGGVYYVRGEMTNKYTNMVSYSDVATFTATQVYKITFTGDDLYMPGTDAVIGLNIANFDGAPTATANLDIVWDVVSSRGAAQTLTDVTTATLNSPEAATYDLTVRVKGKAMDAADPNSWTEVKRQIVFFTPASPRIAVVGPRMLEVTTSGTFKAQLKTPWVATTKTSLQIAGKWTLPDGVTEVAGMEDLVHTAKPEDGQMQTMKYTAWVVGMEADTSATFEYKYSTNTYVFPNLKMVATVDSTFAPAYVKLSVMPSTSYDVQQMRGKKLTYTWTMPTVDFDGSATGYAARGLADKPGTYNFEVVVADERGNNQTLTYELVLSEILPWNLTMKLQPALKFNRHPMPFVIKPGLTGGHPKDRVLETIVSIGGVDQPAVKGLAKMVTIPTPGEHQVTLKLISTMGQTAQTTETVTVNTNQPPVCTLIKTWDKAMTTARVSPRCTDADGKIKKVEWHIDGVLSKRTSNYMFLITSPEKTSFDVRVIITDDSGESTELTDSVTRGG